MQTIEQYASHVDAEINTQSIIQTSGWTPFVPGTNPEVNNTPLDDISNIVSWITSFIPGFVSNAAGTLLGTISGGTHIYLNNEVEGNATRLKLTISTGTFVGCLFLPQTTAGYLIGVGACLLSNIANAAIDQGKKLYLMNLWQNSFSTDFKEAEQSKILKSVGWVSTHR